MMDKMTLTSWLTNEFREWEKSTGHRQTVSAFARRMGIKQPTLNRWMNGDSTPDGDNLRILAKHLGTEIYEVLGLPLPKPELSPIPLDALPTEFKSELSAALEEIKAAFTARSISDPDSPAAIALASSIFEQHGFKVTSTK